MLPNAPLSSFGNVSTSDFCMERLRVLTTRFIACMTLIRCQHEMYLEYSLQDASVTAYIVLDWLRQVTLEASEMFVKIYEEMNLFVKAPKRKEEITKKKTAFARLLGSTYNAILECQTGSMGYPLNVETLGFDLPSALKSLLFVVKGLHSKASNERRLTNLPKYPVKISTLLTGKFGSQTDKLRTTVSDFVLANSRLFITPGPSTVQGWPSQETWGSTEKVEPMIRDSVFSQELSQSHQQNVGSGYPWQIPYSEMNGVQSYSRRHSPSLCLNFASTDFSEAGLFPYSQYDPRNEYDQNFGIEGRSPKNTTVQDVLEIGTDAASQPMVNFEFEREPSIEQCVSIKRGYVDNSPRQAKRQRRTGSLSDQDSPVATPQKEPEASQQESTNLTRQNIWESASSKIELFEESYKRCSRRSRRGFQ
ncbi:MAG: hypothetical protein Q9195_008101 [Heterodermia aff. obscurata]